MDNPQLRFRIRLEDPRILQLIELPLVKQVHWKHKSFPRVHYHLLPMSQIHSAMFPPFAQIRSHLENQPVLSPNANFRFSSGESSLALVEVPGHDGQLTSARHCVSVNADGATPSAHPRTNPVYGFIKKVVIASVSEAIS